MDAAKQCDLIDNCPIIKTDEAAATPSSKAEITREADLDHVNIPDPVELELRNIRERLLMLENTMHQN